MAYPGRILEEEIDRFKEPPSDAFLYLREQHLRKQFSLEEALSMHREVAGPQILDKPDAVIKLRCELNMNSDAKKKKTIGEVKGIIELPHSIEQPKNFDDKMELNRLVLCFVDDKILQEKAKEFGADFVEGKDVVKKIVKGSFVLKEVDYYICHMDMALKIAPLKNILKHKFPSSKGGSLGDDLESMIRLHKVGTQYHIREDDARKTWGLMEMNIGRLDWTNEQIQQNIHTILHKICSHRALSPSLGHFIHDAVLMVDGSSEYFSLKLDGIAPPLPTEDDIKSKKKKKKKLKTVEELVAEKTEKKETKGAAAAAAAASP